jgi:hypothetical protein
MVHIVRGDEAKPPVFSMAGGFAVRAANSSSAALAIWIFAIRVSHRGWSLRSPVRLLNQFWRHCWRPSVLLTSFEIILPERQTHPRE